MALPQRPQTWIEGGRRYKGLWKDIASGIPAHIHKAFVNEL
jgi:hypothetical protein